MNETNTTYNDMVIIVAMMKQFPETRQCPQWVALLHIILDWNESHPMCPI